MKKRLCCFVLAAMASWFVGSFAGAEDYRGRDAHVPSGAETVDNRGVEERESNIAPPPLPPPRPDKSG